MSNNIVLIDEDDRYLSISSLAVDQKYTIEMGDLGYDIVSFEIDKEELSDMVTKLTELKDEE